MGSESGWKVRQRAIFRRPGRPEGCRGRGNPESLAVSCQLLRIPLARESKFMTRPVIYCRSEVSSEWLPLNAQCPHTLQTGCRLLYWGWDCLQNPADSSVQRGHPSQNLPPVPWDRWVSLSVTVTIIVAICRVINLTPPSGTEGCSSAQKVRLHLR